MSLLVTSDLHLTDLPRDSHRWELFPWLAQKADKHKADRILILGDLTDAKDRHSAMLTNLMADSMAMLAINHKVYVLRANHDCIDPNDPFFGFLNHQEDVSFITEPEMIAVGRPDGDLLFLPHSRNPHEDWEVHSEWFKQARLIFCHQTFDGSVVENGTVMKGLSPSIFGKTQAKIYSGDIHVPQVVSKRPYLEHVGSPYRVRFGDLFHPRCLLIRDDLSTLNLHFPTKNKVVIDYRWPEDEGSTIEGPDEIRKGDQVKVRVHLRRKDYDRWPHLRSEVKIMAEEQGWELTGPELIAVPDKPAKRLASQGSPQAAINPTRALAAFGERKRLGSDLMAAGEDYLDKANG